VPFAVLVEFPGIDVQAELLQFAHLPHLFGQPPLEVYLLVEIHNLDGVILPDVLDRLQDEVVREMQLDGGHLHERGIAASQLLPVGKQGVVQRWQRGQRTLQLWKK